MMSFSLPAGSCDCRDRNGPRQFREYFSARPKHFRDAVSEQKDFVDNAYGGRPMRDDDDGHSLFLELRDAIGQCGVAIRIQVRAGFVQHDQAWIAVDRPRQSDSLTIAAREHRPALAHLGLVAIGQAQDHLMHAGELRGLNDLLVGAILESADIGRDRIGEQLDVLRQIAEVTAEGVLRPGRDIGAIKAHSTCGG